MLKFIITFLALIAISNAQIQWNGNWAMGCDFVGNDLASAKTRGEECSSKCQATSGCTHYTWNNYEGGTCWMKKGTVSKQNAVQKSNDYVCGIIEIKTTIQWNGDWALGCDFVGNDLTSAKTKGEDCLNKCRSTWECSHFVWNNYEGGTCWMKKGPISKDKAVPKSNDFVCGIIPGAADQSNGPLPLKKILWSDEFSGDLSNWNQETGGHGWGNQELQYYTDNNRNAKTENGFLKIIAKREQFDRNQYTSARLISKRAFKYGVFEARLKVPRGSGAWPAFWLLAANRPLVWPLDGEIDVMEHWGCNPGVVAANIHTKKYNHMIGTNKGNSIYIQNLFDDFHTYRLDWNANRLIFYVDNRQIFRYDNNENSYEAWPFNNQFNIILNLAVDSKCAQGVDNNFFPAEYVVDYVRQYEAN